MELHTCQPCQQIRLFYAQGIATRASAEREKGERILGICNCICAFGLDTRHGISLTDVGSGFTAYIFFFRFLFLRTTGIVTNIP